MKKDIQIFLGVQVNGVKYVTQKWFSIEQYNNAIDKKAYLEGALDNCFVMHKDLLKEKDMI